MPRPRRRGEVAALRAVVDGEGGRPRRGRAEVVGAGRADKDPSRRSGVPFGRQEPCASRVRAAEHDRHRAGRGRHRLNGRRAELGQVQVDGLPGTDRTASYWARELRVPLTAAIRAGLDLRYVKSLDLTPRSPSGRAWLLDAWGWAPGTPAARAATLPRVDIGRLTVKEGDSGTLTYHIPVQVSGHGSGTVRFSVLDPDTGQAKDELVTVRPGSSPSTCP